MEKALMIFAEASIRFAQYLEGLHCTCNLEGKERCSGDCMSEVASRFLRAVESKLIATKD